MTESLYNVSIKKTREHQIYEDNKGPAAWPGMLHGVDQGSYSRTLRTILRSARRWAGMIQVDAAWSLEWSVSKMSRIETGRVGVIVPDVKALLYIYGVDDPVLVDSIVNLAREAKAERRRRSGQ